MAKISDQIDRLLKNAEHGYSQARSQDLEKGGRAFLKE